MERAAPPHHPRTARSALGQHPQVVGRAAGERIRLHALRLSAAQPLADEWRGGLSAQPARPVGLPHALLPGPAAAGLRDAPQQRRAATARAWPLRDSRPRLRRRPIDARQGAVRARLGRHLDVSADEYYGGEQVKRALVRYPLKVVRLDVDAERNPFGLALDCYSGTPQRISAPTPSPAPTTPATPADPPAALPGATP